MNVPNIRQGPGSTATLLRAGTDAGVLAPARSDAPAAASRAQAPAAGISLTRLAWFDVNGDGQIDPRSAASGGDATLLVPTHGVDLPTWTRPVHTIEEPHAIRATEPAAGERTSAHTPANAARTNRAVDAYQRYGQTTPTPPTPPTPQPAPPQPAAPQSSPVAADVTAALSTGAATGR